MLGRGFCEELITRPEEFYRLCCVVVCDLENLTLPSCCVALCIFLCYSMYLCVLCIVCFMTFPVLFVCICVLNNFHRVATQLQLSIYHIIYMKNEEAIIRVGLQRHRKKNLIMECGVGTKNC